LPRLDATLAACKLRLRPILMTSFAFILGVVPLIFGTGAGHEMRWTLGLAVFSGMLGVTLFGIFLTPVFFFVIEWFVEGPLFSSARARSVGRALRVGAAIGSLGVLWLPTLVSRGLRRRPRVPVGAGKKLAEVNGNGAGKPTPAPRPVVTVLDGHVVAGNGGNGTADNGKDSDADPTGLGAEVRR
jgi:multidrug efflux pump